jgi:hypothetical protein
MSNPKLNKALSKIATLNRAIRCLCPNNLTDTLEKRLKTIEDFMANSKQIEAYSELQGFIYELEHFENDSFVILFTAQLNELENDLLPDIDKTSVYFSWEGDFVSEQDATHTLQVNTLAAHVIKASQNPTKTLKAALEQCGWNVPELNDVVAVLEKIHTHPPKPLSELPYCSEFDR